MLKFNGSWRLDSPGAIPNGVVWEFSELIGKIAAHGDLQPILEHFKQYFAGAAGTTSSWSSSASWAQTDLQHHMGQAAANAPLFIEAFYDACNTVGKDIAVPDVGVMNRALAKHDAGYEIRPPDLIATDATIGPRAATRTRIGATPLAGNHFLKHQPAINFLGKGQQTGELSLQSRCPVEHDCERPNAFFDRLTNDELVAIAGHAVFVKLRLLLQGELK
jgi:hypothetical protein